MRSRWDVAAHERDLFLHAAQHGVEIHSGSTVRLYLGPTRARQQLIPVNSLGSAGKLLVSTAFLWAPCAATTKTSATT